MFKNKWAAIDVGILKGHYTQDDELNLGLCSVVSSRHSTRILPRVLPGHLVKSKTASIFRHPALVWLC